MKHSFSHLIFISCLMALTPLYAATETLTTYYPAPAGVYNKLQSTGMILTPSTQASIQNMYKCSFVPNSGLPNCPVGLIYYDTNSNEIMYSNGSQWQALLPSGAGIMTCTHNISYGFNGQGAYFIPVTAADCGGALPDNTYMGVLKSVQICNGTLGNVSALNFGESTATSFQGNQSGPGLFFWASSPCTWPNGYQGIFTIVYLKSS